MWRRRNDLLPVNEMTNCDEYREAISADPAFEGGDEHLSVCSECRAYRREMQSLNVKIAKAMQLSVPVLKLPELPTIDTQNILPMAARKPLSRPVWFAMAASVMLAAVISVRMFGFGVTYDSLGDEILAHLDHEPAALRVTSVAVSDKRLQKAVPADIARMDHTGGLITYAQSCKINGKQVPHLVIQGESGPITILLMPDEAVAEAEQLEGESIRGVILPVGGGSIAIIGDREEQLDRVEKSVLNSVTWST
jgi:hypothetical protein